MSQKRKKKLSQINLIAKVKLISDMALELCRQRFEWAKNEKENLSQNVLESQGQAII